jgi:hypothetical protein
LESLVPDPVERQRIRVIWMKRRRRLGNSVLVAPLDAVVNWAGAGQFDLAVDVRVGLLRDRDDGGGQPAGSTWIVSGRVRFVPHRARRI